MKIVHFTRSLDPSYGGTVSASISYHECTKITGHDSRLVGLSGCLDNLNADYTVLQGPTSGYGFSIKSLIAFYRAHMDADFIFVHGLWQFHGVIALMLSLICGIKIVVVPHGMAAKYFDQFYLKRVKKWLYWFCIERNLVKRCAAVLYLGVGERDTVSEYFRSIASSKSLIIPISFDGTRGKNYIKKTVVGRVEFLFVGRNHLIKGVDHLIKMLDLALLSLNIEATLTLVGDFDEAALKKNYFIKSGLVLNCVGPVYGDEKYQYMAAATCLVIPSYYESFGMVALEALSVGTPVLVSEFVGIGKDLKDLDYCVTYRLDSEQSLADGVSKILLMAEMNPSHLEKLLSEYNAESIQKKIAVFLRSKNANTI